MSLAAPLRTTGRPGDAEHGGATPHIQDRMAPLARPWPESTRSGAGKAAVPWRLAMGALALVITFSAVLVAPLIPGVGLGERGGRRSGPRDPAGAGIRGGHGRSRHRRRGRSGVGAHELDAPGGHLRHRLAAGPAGDDVRRHRAAGRRVLPDDAGTSTAATGPVPRAAPADALRQGVHRLRIGHRQHEHRLPGRPRLHRGHLRRAGHRRLGRRASTSSTPCSRPTARRWRVGPRKLPHADGEVGLFGESYMGINQFQTVQAAGKDSPIKAMFPIISGNDLYSDTVTQGGIPDAEFAATYIALLSGLNLTNPALQPLVARCRERQPRHPGLRADQPAPTEAQHSPVLVSFLKLLLNVETGQGAGAFDDSYWAARSPAHDLPDVVADNIPAFLVGGWNDLFESGEPMNYVGLQNLFDGRPQNAAMTSDAAGHAPLPAPDGTVAARDHRAPASTSLLSSSSGSTPGCSASRRRWPTTTTPLHLDIENSGRLAGSTQAAVAPARGHADVLLLRRRAERQRPRLAQRRRPDHDAAELRAPDRTRSPSPAPPARATSRRTSGAPVRWRSGSSRSAPTTPATSTT